MKTMQMHSGSIVSRTADILFTKLDDDMLALDEQREYCYALNESAGRVWELIGTPTSVSAICVRLCQEFAVDEETCVREVLQLLQGLHEAGLVQVNDAASA